MDYTWEEYMKDEAREEARLVRAAEENEARRYEEE